MPPPIAFKPEDDWYIGKPDLLVTMSKEHKMYPKGPDWWIDYFRRHRPHRGPLDPGDGDSPGQPQDRPSSRCVCDRARRTDGDTGTLLHEYAVGKVRRHLRGEHRPPLKAGSRIRFDLHYFADRRGERDQTTIAFKFYPEGASRRSTRCASGAVPQPAE
jgi:hypothetical protein